MTRKRLLLLIPVLILLATVMKWQDKPIYKIVLGKVKAPFHSTPDVRSVKHTSPERKPSSKDQKPVDEKSDTTDVKTTSAPDHWEEKAKEIIQVQGGPHLKEVNIRELESREWKQDGVILQVKSVIVTVKNHRNEEVAFRAMIDTATGKILQSWDQPVFDPMNPREKFVIAVDPRSLTGQPSP